MNVRVVWRQHALGKVDKELGCSATAGTAGWGLPGAPCGCVTDRVLLRIKWLGSSQHGMGLFQVSVSVVRSFRRTKTRDE